MKELIENSIKNILLSKERYFEIAPEDRLTQTQERNGVSYLGDYLYNIHDKEILINVADAKEYYPENFLKYDFKKILDDTKVRFVWKSFIKNVTSDIDIILYIRKGSICGVGYGDGYELQLGVRYHGLMIKYYHFKDSTNHWNQYLFNINGIWNTELLKSIDFNEFEEVKYNISFGDYKLFDSSKTTNWYEIFKLCMTDGTFKLTDSFLVPIALDHGRTEDYPADLFVKLGIEKLIISSQLLRSFNYDMPTNCIVEFDIQKEMNPNNEFLIQRKTDEKIKEIIKSCPIIRPYLSQKLKDPADRITFLQKEWQLYNTPVLIRFKYGNLEGLVKSNEYQYRAFKEFYDKYEIISLDVAGLDLVLNRQDFYNCISVETKIKYKNKLDTATSYFGSNKIGYTVWFNKKIDISPETI